MNEAPAAIEGSPIVRSEWVLIADLKEFPNNARTHNTKAAKVMTRSVADFGQYRSVAVQDGTMYVVAGWHTVKECEAQGKIRVKVDFIAVDDVTAKAINALDNRMNDLGGYDTEKQLANLQVLPDIEAAGYTERDIQVMISRLNEDVNGDTSPKLSGLIYKVVVEAADEQQQADLLRRFADEGLKCSALMA